MNLTYRLQTVFVFAMPLILPKKSRTLNTISILNKLIIDNKSQFCKQWV